MREPVHISLEDAIPSGDFVVPPHYEGEVGSILIPYHRIFKRVVELAESIQSDYRHDDLHLIAVMDGADMFCTDLMNTLSSDIVPQHQLYRHNITAKSYENTQSSANLKVTGDISWVEDKRILLIEDIVDTGHTMSSLINLLEQKGARDVKSASMLVKRTLASNGFTPDYAGFSIPDEFVIGYGMDYKGYWRNAPGIFAVKGM